MKAVRPGDVDMRPWSDRARTHAYEYCALSLLCVWCVVVWNCELLHADAGFDLGVGVDCGLTREVPRTTAEWECGSGAGARGEGGTRERGF